MSLYYIIMGVCLATLSCSFCGKRSKFCYCTRDERLRFREVWLGYNKISVAHVGIINLTEYVMIRKSPGSGTAPRVGK